jgi:N-carbamoyl-L-amino-acid hydrolase
VLEQVALIGFKTKQLTMAQVRRMLGFESRLQVHEFLAAHDVPWIDYDEDELQREVETLKKLAPYGILSHSQKEACMNRREFNLNLLLAMPAAALPLPQSSSQLRINGPRVNAHLAELAQFGKTPEGGTHRVAYSDADLQARQYAMKLMREARLDVSIDAAGNIIGRRAGSDAALKPLMFGSHIDSVPEGGSYDGQVGSMGAIEVAQTLAENNARLRHPLEVALFQNEEGGTIGSHAIAKGLSEKELNLVTNSRKTIREGIKFIGGDPDKLAGVVRKKGDLAAYVELHIEQGGILHQEKINIGVVEGIVGVNWWDVTIEGFANHAGTTPMNARRDALLAAAKYIEAVNRVVTSVAGRQVGTVGRIQAFPGAYNVVPGKVTTSLGLRDLDAAKVQMLFEKIQAGAREIEKATGTKFEFKQVNATPPAPTDARIRRVIDESAKQLGFTTKLMPSGAGHDAQEIANLCPVGMIFVPSRDGISHSPREFSTPEDIANGTNVLLHTLIKLDAMSY